MGATPFLRTMSEGLKAASVRFAKIAEQDLSEIVRAAIDRGQTALATVRRWRGMTQLALARAVGCSEGYISELEKGEKPGSSALRVQIAESLRVSPDLLWPNILGEGIDESLRNSSQHRDC